MASTLPPVRGVAFSFPVMLVKQSDVNRFQETVTLAAGDIQVSKDGGHFANLATFPPGELQLASNANSGMLWVTLTAAEMTADVVTVLFRDANGAEWQSKMMVIYTSGQTLDAIDGVVDSILADTGTDGVLVAAEQGAIIWGQQTIEADVEGAGALYVRNTADTGVGVVLQGGIDGVSVQATKGIMGNLIGSVGSVAANGISAISIATDAITAGKIAADAITSSELAASAATEIAAAVWNAPRMAYDTSGTFGERVNDLDTSAVTVVSAVDGGTLTFFKDTTFRATISGLTIPAAWTACYFTVKQSADQADALAKIQIRESNPGVGTGGLLYLAGAAVASPITAADGELVVSQTQGTVTITLSDNAAAYLTKARGLVWDIKTIETATTTLLITGVANILPAITVTK